MKISYVHGICMQHDAISNSIRDEIRWLMPDHDVRLFTYACDHADFPSTVVTNVTQLVLDPHFQTSDVVVFHFGVYYPLFDAIIACPNRARRLVVFHNITPKAFVPVADQLTVERSFEQLSNVVFAHHVICDSQTNLAVLREAGIQTGATVLPLALHSHPVPPQSKPSAHDGKVRIAFVGRFVRSKGITELTAAVEQVLRASPATVIQLEMVGNLKFSDAGLLADLQSTIARLHRTHGKRIQASVHGNATDELKARVLSDADLFVLPTYHEGFCVPILEALASGCRIISYDNSNVPAISGGLGTLVPTGDVDALATAIMADVALVTSPSWSRPLADGYHRYAERASTYTNSFRPELIRRRFLALIRNFSRATH